MSIFEHCNLCDNAQTNLKFGLTCGLTNKKPDFEKTCSTINLNIKFQEKIEQTNLELEKIRKDKNTIHFKFYTQIIIGFALMFISISILKLNFSGYLIYFAVYGFISSGLALWGLAFNKLNIYRTKINSAKFHKNKIDEILKLYGIEYKTNIVFKEKIHGIQESIVELEFNYWTKKHTKNLYETK